MEELIVPGLPFGFVGVGGASQIEPEVTDGVVTLFAAAGADLFVDPSGAQTRPDAHRFLAPVEGDFQFSSKVEPTFVNKFDSGVLIGWFDDTHWFKVCAELDPHGVPRVVSVVTSGTSDDANAWPMTDAFAWLRISRSGEAFALHASSDGATWDMVRYFAMNVAVSAPLRIGFLAQSPAGPGTRAKFSNFGFVPEALLDARDGS